MTSNMIDQGPGNFRLSIDESVFSALLECAYSDPKHQVIGYLGGKCSIDKNTIICHVNQFIALERYIPSLFTDAVKEVDLAYEEAIRIFKNMGLVLVGWYRSNISSISNSIITQADITKQQKIQIQHPNSAGIIISISTTGFPSLGPKGQISDGITNTFCTFRTSENTDLSNFDTVNTVLQGAKSKNGKIWKGKGKELPKVNRVTFSVNKQLYTCPNVMQQLCCALMTILQESKQVYDGQVLDCENRIGQKLFVDSQYESFLMNFLKKSVVQFDRSVDQDFRSLSIAKHHVKMLISKHLNETLGILQHNKIKDENQLNLLRRRLEKLTEKMVMQRLSKRDMEMKKINQSEFDVIKWFNTKSSLVSQDIINQDTTINCSTALNDNGNNNNNLMSIDTNGSDTLLGYKLSEHFKEFAITENELDLMNEKSSVSQLQNIIPLDDIPEEDTNTTTTTTDIYSTSNKSNALAFNLEAKNDYSSTNILTSTTTPVVNDSSSSSSAVATIGNRVKIQNVQRVTQKEN